MEETLNWVIATCFHMQHPLFLACILIILMPLYITLSELVYNGSHTCLLNPLKYSQTCMGHGRSDQSATCKLAMQLALSVTC